MDSGLKRIHPSIQLSPIKVLKNWKDLSIKERQESRHKSCEESQKKDEDSLTHTEDAKCQITVDKMNRVDLAAGLRLLKISTMKLNNFLEQRRLHEEEV